MEPKATTRKEKDDSLQHIVVNVKKLAHFDNNFSLPSYETMGSSGADIRACLPAADHRGSRDSLVIAPFDRVLIPTGLAMEIPPGYEIQVRPRSGLSLKTPLFLCNSPGTIDSDYRGEIKIIMGNLSPEPFEVRHGERIAQIVLAPTIRAAFQMTTELKNTTRGEKGFGHTGIN